MDMKWKKLLDFKCPGDDCKGILTTINSLNTDDQIHTCNKCSFFITNPRFKEIIENMITPKRFPMPEPPDFIKEMRKCV